MLLPKKVLHRKWHKGRRRQLGVATRSNFVAFGEYGIKSQEHGWVSSRQIEAARISLSRALKKGGKIWIRVFPDKPVTIKGNEIRMGGGKGAVDHYVVVVKPGMILFEMDGVKEDIARQAMKLAAYKLPVTSKFIMKEN